jgi:hypothetical protein
MRDRPLKQPYVQPKLTVHGDMAKITLGKGIGLRDMYVGGDAINPVHRCGPFHRCGSRR